MLPASAAPRRADRGEERSPGTRIHRLARKARITRRRLASGRHTRAGLHQRCRLSCRARKAQSATAHAAATEPEAAPGSRSPLCGATQSRYTLSYVESGEHVESAKALLMASGAVEAAPKIDPLLAVYARRAEILALASPRF